MVEKLHEPGWGGQNATVIVSGSTESQSEKMAVNINGPLY